jgi:riboflavin kinase
MSFTGQVVGGMGQGAQFLGLEWVVAQLRMLLDLTAYPGTLNLRVLPESRDKLFSRRQQFLRIADPASPACPGYLTEVTLHANGRRLESAYLILPEKTVYDDVLEFIAPVNLRDTLSLKDGDTVTVDAMLD